ncbi:MAG: asparagine synthetase B, partial [Clostridia bacterium]|nr:asparagine synthetase B [Clostridia bacterium]
MCSVFGYCGPVADRTAFGAGFERTKSRGPDATRTVPAGDGLFGFHRLSIMGLTDEGMQPFSLDGDLCVCNGELYGFAAERDRLKSLGYEFKSDSDCE